MNADEDTIYWAEAALGESFVQDLSFVKRAHRQGLVLSGVAFASTVSIGLALSPILAPARLPVVHVVGVVAAPSSPAQANIAPRLEPMAMPGSTSSATQSTVAPHAVFPKKTVDPTPAAKPSGSHPPRANSAQGREAHAVPAASVTPSSALRPAPPQSRQAGQLPGARDRVLPERAVAPPPSAPVTQPPVTHTGLSAAAASKPQDIAPGEKLGIKEVYSEGVELLNGKRIRNGSSLPNGEQLMGTDPTKGMVETDRRVMTLAR